MQLPSGPPFFTECSSVLRAPGLGPGGSLQTAKQVKILPFRPFLLPWSNIRGIRLLSGTMQVRLRFAIANMFMWAPDLQDLGSQSCRQRHCICQVVSK